jgi:prevent-host-death family protein
MQILPISKAKERLDELVDAASTTREQVTITKNGTPAAVLIGVDEWESLQETLFWLSQPGIRESISEATSDVSAGRVYTQEGIRAEFIVATSEPRGLHDSHCEAGFAAHPSTHRPRDH